MRFSKINDMDVATIKKDLENQLGDINKELENIYLPHDAVLILLGKRTAFEIALDLIDSLKHEPLGAPIRGVVFNDGEHRPRLTVDSTRFYDRLKGFPDDTDVDILIVAKKEKESLHVPESCEGEADSFTDEDERIRKELVAFFKGMQDSDWHEKYWHDLEIVRILSYLEKQEHFRDDTKMMEQSEMDLEKEYQEFCKDNPFPWSSQFVNREYIDELCLSVARHFYELGLNARKEEQK